jgi:hypothetical protein
VSMISYYVVCEKCKKSNRLKRKNTLLMTYELQPEFTRFQIRCSKCKHRELCFVLGSDDLVETLLESNVKHFSLGAIAPEHVVKSYLKHINFKLIKPKKLSKKQKKMIVKEAALITDESLIKFIADTKK